MARLVLLLLGLGAAGVPATGGDRESVCRARSGREGASGPIAERAVSSPWLSWEQVMEKNALYFAYIRVPDDPWFVRVLLDCGHGRHDCALGCGTTLRPSVAPCQEEAFLSKSHAAFCHIVH